MALLRYLTKGKSALPDKSTCPSLTRKEVDSANECVKDRLQQQKITPSRTKYASYTPQERALIGKYAAENGPTKAARHFSNVLKKAVPEPTARRLKKEYLRKLAENTRDENLPRTVTSLPTKPQRRVLDEDVQEYVRSQRAVGGVVNTAIVRASAEEGIILARDRSLLVKYGGHIDLTKSWAKSLLHRMGYSKRRGSHAGKVALPHLKEIQENFLADIQSEVVMNDIPSDLIFNWDQTALRLVPTGQWTMHPAGAKVVPIANSDDKRQVTAVLAATLTGEFLPPQIITKERQSDVIQRGLYLMAGTFGTVVTIGQTKI